MIRLKNFLTTRIEFLEISIWGDAELLAKSGGPRFTESVVLGNENSSVGNYTHHFTVAPKYFPLNKHITVGNLMDFLIVSLSLKLALC